MWTFWCFQALLENYTVLKAAQSWLNTTIGVLSSSDVVKPMIWEGDMVRIVYDYLDTSEYLNIIV